MARSTHNSSGGRAGKDELSTKRKQSGSGKNNNKKKKKEKSAPHPLFVGESLPRLSDAVHPALSLSFPATAEGLQQCLETICINPAAAYSLDGNKYLRDHFKTEFLEETTNPQGDGNCLLYSILISNPDIASELVDTICSNREKYCHADTPPNSILLCTILFLL